MRLLARRAVVSLVVVLILGIGAVLTTASPGRADQCPPVATTSVAMRVNGHIAIGGAGAATGTAILAIGPGIGALPDGCTTVVQQGTFAITVYGYDPAVSASQTYPRDSDVLTLYASDAGGNLTFLRPAQSITFRSGTTMTVDLCSSCDQAAARATAIPDTPTPTPSPSPAASATSTPSGTLTATPMPTPTAAQAAGSGPTAAPVAISGSGGLPAQFAGTPSASLPSNFATGGPDTSSQAPPPPSVGVLSPTPHALVVPGPVQLPPDGSIAVTVVLRGSASAPDAVGPALTIAARTLMTDTATGQAFSGTLSPPAFGAALAASPAADQALQRDLVAALAPGGQATYAIQADGARIAQFSQPATLSLPAQPPAGYDPSELHMAWFDPALVVWRDVPGASPDGGIVVAPVVRTGLYAVVAGDAGGFRRFWVQTLRPTTLWSGSDSQAVALGVAEQWHHLVVLAPQQGPRLYVRNPSTGGAAYVGAADVGPSGPP